MAGSALANTVTTDYDHHVDFSKYKTFMWVQEPNPQEAFMKDRIMKSVNIQLQARGMRLVTEGADMAIGSHVATEERHTWDTYYTGGWGWGWDGSWTAVERTYEVGTLTVDLFDAKAKKLVWQGNATDDVHTKPEHQTREYEKQVEKMFKAYPPLYFRESELRTPPSESVLPLAIEPVRNEFAKMLT
jgi:hypothetical protein